MPMRGFFIDNAAFEKYHRRIGARRLFQILKKVSDSTMFPDDPDKGDALFTPRTEAEAEYWKLLRDDIKQSAERYLANKSNGKRGGRPAKTSEPPKPKPDLQKIIKNTLHDARNPWQKILITESFDLTKLEGAVGDAMRMRYPVNRSDTLIKLSQWLRSPNNLLGEYVDAKWLANQADKFYNARPRKPGTF